MNEPRHAGARRAALRALPAAALVLALGASAAPPSAAAPPGPAPPVQLVETRPVETALGNPALPAALETWLALIGGAKRSLDFEEFYLSTWPGEPMEQVLEVLGQAAARGVRVRILLDARMYRTYPRTADSLAHVRGFEVRLIDFARLGGGVQHSKFFLVDGGAVFIGSQNLDWRALKHIHELGVLVRDAGVAMEFQRVFDRDWALGSPPGEPPDTTVGMCTAQVSRQPGELPFRVVQAPGDTVLVWPGYSPRGLIPDSTQWDRDLIVRTLDGARREVVLQLLSYAPTGRRERDATLDAALRRAAARGVAVKLLISDWETNSPGLADLQDLARVPGIEVKLSTVPEWSGGYIPFARVEHCKYFVVDTLWTWIGTSNWEPSYFLTSRNVAVTMRNRPLAEAARAVFETSWRAPGAAGLDPGATYPPKVRGEEPPPGKRKYGG